MAEADKKKRVRLKDPVLQLQAAINRATALAEMPKEERGETFISEMKLVTTLIKTLTVLDARKRHDTFLKLNEEMRAKDAEIEKLKGDLAAALAAKPTVVPQAPVVTDIERALAKYNAERGGQQ